MRNIPAKLFPPVPKIYPLPSYSRLQPRNAAVTTGQGRELDTLARMLHELMLRDHEDGRATGHSQGVGSEAYLNGTSQETTPEDAQKDDHIQGRSKQFMKHPG